MHAKGAADQVIGRSGGGKAERDDYGRACDGRLRCCDIASEPVLSGGYVGSAVQCSAVLVLQGEW